MKKALIALAIGLSLLAWAEYAGAQVPNFGQPDCVASGCTPPPPCFAWNTCPPPPPCLTWVGCPGPVGPQGPPGPAGPKGEKGDAGALPNWSKIFGGPFDVGLPIGQPTAQTSVFEWSDGTYSNIVYVGAPYFAAALIRYDAIWGVKCLQISLNFHPDMPFTSVLPVKNRAFAWFGKMPGGPWVFDWDQNLPDYRTGLPCPQ